MRAHGTRIAEARRREAEAFLQTVLAGGPVPVPEIQAKTKAAGLSWRGVLRAQVALGAESRKASFNGGWAWSLPAKNGGNQEDSAAPPKANSGEDQDPLAEVVARLLVTWTPAGEIETLSVPRQVAEAFAAHREELFTILRRARAFRQAAGVGCVGCRRPLAADRVLCNRCQLALHLARAH